MRKSIFLCIYFACIFGLPALAQPVVLPIAKFSFNNGSGIDEINQKNARLVGTLPAADRFGNDNNAVFLCGNENSYINLGSYKELKPKEGSISLWLSVEDRVMSGKGPLYNPIILTKYTGLDDFYEAYSVYYMLDSDRLAAVTTQDSTKEVALFSMRPFKRNQWCHVVVAYDYNYLWFYVNGKCTGKMLKDFETKFLESDPVFVGGTGNKKNMRFLIGLIDDIEFFDKVLTEEEVLELYHAPNPNREKVFFRWLLLGAIILLIIAFIYVLIKKYIKKSIHREKQRLELANRLLEDELRINRALMNPHFVFNSLNTLHNYILMNNIDRASDYLVKFSKLIRKILDSSLSDTISLELEIELLQRYIELEGMRFKEHIQHAFIIDPRLIPSAITIPIMMLQPFIENSVWHGLLDKIGDKILTVTFLLHEEKYIKCIIEDNGTGRKNKSNIISEKKSLATGFIKHRLQLLNNIHGLTSSLIITDKPRGEGTIVEIILPILNK